MQSNITFTPDNQNKRHRRRCGAQVLTATFILTLATSTSRANTVIVQDTFNFYGWSEDIADTTPDTANLPGGKWVSIVNSSWSQPYVNGSRESHWARNAVDMDQEKASINISLSGHNKGRLRISADIANALATSEQGIALGFKPSVSGAGLQPNLDPTKDFTGIAINGAGTVSLIANGGVQPATASIGPLTEKKFYTLSYDADIATGDIFNIKFDGTHLPDFKTTAFTSSATSYASFMVLEGARGAVDNFTVTSIEGFEAPSVVNVPDATTPEGAGVTLSGILTGGNTADVYVYWGINTNHWANTNFVGKLPDGMFSTTVSGLEVSTRYFYRCFATNSVGGAWADSASSFLSAAQPFTWTGAGGNAKWNDPANWNPTNRFPGAARESATLVNTDSSPIAKVYLNQPTVTTGGITLVPPNWSSVEFDITTNAPGQKLVLDNADRPAFLKVLGDRWGDGIISAPLVLKSDVEVSTVTGQDRFGLNLRGPLSGRGRLFAKTGRVRLDPVVDTTYVTGFHGAKGGGRLSKRGRKTATLTGVSDIALDGGWDGAAAISGGGSLVISGGVLTNRISSTRGILFGDAGNSLIIADGGRLVHAYGGNGAFIGTVDNQIEITGQGSLWDLHGDTLFMGASSNRLTLANGGRLMRAPTRIGWGSSHNAVTVSGAASLWNAGGPITIGGGADSTKNSLTIADGATVENTWIWLGGYAYSENGGGCDNSLVITNGGKLFSGGDDGIAMGSCIGVSGVGGGRVDRNTAIVTGKDSLWDLQGRDLRIGYVTTAGAGGIRNRIHVEAGGTLTGVNILSIGCTANGGSSSGNELSAGHHGSISAENIAVGSETSHGNILILAGGIIDAAELTVHRANILSPVIGKEGAKPINVSGTATFAENSRVCPVAAAGIKPGTNTVLTAGKVVDNGLIIDPAQVTGNWKLIVDETSVKVVFGGNNSAP